jgi:hypothetical protein
MELRHMGVAAGAIGSPRLGSGHLMHDV